MSGEGDRVAISVGENVLLGDSSLPEEAEGVAIPSGEGALGNSPVSRQQESRVNHGPNMSIDELLEVIETANGIPVLLLRSTDGRLAAIAVDSIQNLVPAGREGNGSDEKKEKAFRSWLLFLTSLVATVTFTAGLTPPGGFWPADDKANGYLAGTSIMRDKFHWRYFSFYCSNTTAFSSALTVIAMLANNQDNMRVKLVKKRFFALLVGVCFLSLEISYMSGTWTSTGQHWSSTVQRYYGGALVASVPGYMMGQCLTVVARGMIPERFRALFFGQ